MELHLNSHSFRNIGIFCILNYKNSSMNDQFNDPSYHGATSHSFRNIGIFCILNYKNSSMKDRSHDLSHHEWTLYHGAASHSFRYVGMYIKLQAAAICSCVFWQTETRSVEVSAAPTCR